MRDEIRNFYINEKEGFVIISVNPKLYPIEVIYPAAYMFLEDFWINIDGNPEVEIIVEMRPKKEKSPEDLAKAAREFFNELINYATYVIQALRNAGLRSAILHKAFGVSEMAEDEVEDPEGIAEPWTPEKMEGLEVPEEIKKILEKAKQIEEGEDGIHGC